VRRDDECNGRTAPSESDRTKVQKSEEEEEDEEEKEG